MFAHDFYASVLAWAELNGFPSTPVSLPVRLVAAFSQEEGESLEDADMDKFRDANKRLRASKGPIWGHIIDIARALGFPVSRPRTNPKPRKNGQ